MSISPDGSKVAYPAMTSNGNFGLWVRALNSLDAKLLPGTEGAFASDWSPDSRFIVFPVDGHLKKIDVRGGPPQTLTDIDQPFGAARGTVRGSSFSLTAECSAVERTGWSVKQR